MSALLKTWPRTGMKQIQGQWHGSKENLVFVDAINYECKDSCTPNFESGEENFNELASYIESPTELKLIVNV